MPTTKTATG